MRAAAAEQRYERAAWLRRRRERIATLVRALDGTLQATHARPRLVLAPHPRDARRYDAFWLAEGRIVDWGPSAPPATPAERAICTSARGAPSPGARRRRRCLPPDEVAEARIVQTWLARHEAPALELDPLPRARGAAGVRQSVGVNGSSTTSAVAPPATSTRVAGRGLAAHERERDRAERGGDERARQPPDDALAEAQLGAGGHRLGQPQAAQVAVGLAAVEQPRDGLLADVAALREAHGAGVEARPPGGSSRRRASMP